MAEDEANSPSPRKIVNGRTIYRSRNDFGSPETIKGKPVLTDFDNATYGNASYDLIHPIQPDPYRAPEVCLEAPWSYSADIWNLGLMVVSQQ